MKFVIKILSGSLYGIGFGIGFLLILQGYSMYVDRNVEIFNESIEMPPDPKYPAVIHGGGIDLVTEVTQELNDLYSINNGPIDLAQFTGVLFTSSPYSTTHPLGDFQWQLWLTTDQLWFLFVENGKPTFTNKLTYPKSDPFEAAYYMMAGKKRILQSDLSFYTIAAEEIEDHKKLSKFFGPGRLIKDEQFMYWSHL